MAQVKLTKLDATVGYPQEMNSAADEITLLGYTVTGGGPVLDGTGLDLNNQDVVDIDLLGFNDPTSASLTLTAGNKIPDKIMFDDRENSIELGSAILFPVITDVADNVDAFRLPVLAGIPTATPTDGGEGYGVWDSTNDTLYIWDGAAWKDQSAVESSERVCNPFTVSQVAGIAIGELVYISAADTVSLADVSAQAAAARVWGMASSAAADAGSVSICDKGVVTGLSGLTAGSRYFANPAVAGGITTTRPVGAGNVIIGAGFAKSATEFSLRIQEFGRIA